VGIGIIFNFKQCKVHDVESKLTSKMFDKCPKDSKNLLVQFS